MCGSSAYINGANLTLLSQVFRRSFGGGWWILSGSSPTVEDRGIERLLEITDRSRPVLILKPGDEEIQEIDQWVEDMVAILEIEHTQLDLESLQNIDLEPHLREAGMLIGYGGNEAQWLYFLRDTITPLLDEALASLPDVLWFVGSATQPLGEWIYSTLDDAGGAALSWLPGCLILQERGDLSVIEPVQSILRTQIRSYALNLVGPATIALGPTGEIDLWGLPPPSIILGQGWGEA
jgi:hypothetical protein